jgi:hypothetical protein
LALVGTQVAIQFWQDRRQRSHNSRNNPASLN